MSALRSFRQFRINGIYMHSAFGMCRFLGMGKPEHGRFIRVEVAVDADVDQFEFEISNLGIQGFWAATEKDIPEAMYRAETEYYKYPPRDKSFYLNMFTDQAVSSGQLQLFE